MTSRDRMLTALRNGVPDVVPTFLCYHGMYLNRHTTLQYLLEYRRRLGNRARYPVEPDEDLEIRRHVIRQTIELFAGRIDHEFPFPVIRPMVCPVMSPEFIHTTIQYLDSDDLLVIGDESGVRVEGRATRGYWNQGAVIETRTDVDRLFEPASTPASPAAAPAAEDPYADLREMHRAANRDLFRCGSFPSPFCHAIGVFSYQGAMLAMHDKPDVFGYFIERVTQQHLAAIRNSDADGFWFDEYYTDVISPEHYMEYVFRPNRRLARALRDAGKASMYYYCGDIMPRLDLALQLDVDAIAFEESKKWFRLDVAEVKRVVGRRKALVGNMDGMHLLPRGTKVEIIAEVRRQLDAAAREGGFVMGAGSPIAPDTPAENMRAFLDATRELGRYPM